MSTKHTITAELEITFDVSGPDSAETVYPKAEISYTFEPGCDEHRGARGWEPGVGDQIDFVSAKLIDGDGISPTQDQLNDWAEAWLIDAGYDRAIDNATTDNETDPDAAYDAKRDEQATGAA